MPFLPFSVSLTFFLFFTVFFYRYASECGVLLLFSLLFNCYFTHFLSIIVYVPKVTLVFLFWLATALPPLGWRFAFVPSALSSTSLTRFLGFVLFATARELFISPLVGYSLSVFVAYNRFGGLFFILALPGSYTSVPLVSFSLPFPFPSSGPHSSEWLSESYIFSRVWFIRLLQTLTMWG